MAAISPALISEGLKDVVAFISGQPVTIGVQPEVVNIDGLGNVTVSLVSNGIQIQKH